MGKDTIDKVVNRNLPEDGGLNELIYYARKDEYKIIKIVNDYIDYSKKKDTKYAYNKCRDNYLKGRYEK